MTTGWQQGGKTRPGPWPEPMEQRLHAVEMGMEEHERKLAMFGELNAAVAEMQRAQFATALAVELLEKSLKALITETVGTL